MPDIRIHREHHLGLTKARKVALQWAEEVEKQFGMECTVVEGEHSDTVEFTRSGCHGQLVVAADHFDLHAKLGFLLGAFSRTIETEIQKNLDKLLTAPAPVKAPKATAKSAKTEAKLPAKTPAATAAAKKAPKPKG